MSDGSDDFDDPEIPDDEVLYRRVNPNWISPQGKVTSQAFQNHRDHEAFSVFLASKLGDTRVPDLLMKFPGYRLAKFSAGEARSYSQGITHEPTDEDSGHAHGHVNGRKSKGIQRNFAEISELIQPDEMEKE